MPDQMSLEGILNDEKPEPREPVSEPLADAPAADAPAEPKVDRVQSIERAWEDKEQGARGRVRDPVTGQFVQKAEVAAAEPKPEPKADPKAAPAKEGAKSAAPPQQEFTEKEKAFLRAAQEERGKRQAMEQELAALKATKAAPGAPTEPAKTFWDDPDGALKRHEESIRTETTNARLNTSEFIARQRHPDFAEKVAVFQDFMAKAGPNTVAIAQQWISSPDPAMYAYNFGKNHLELQQVGGLDAMRAKIEKETEAKIRAQVEAEFKAKSESLDKARSELPGSLSDVRSSGVNRPAWGGVPALEDILKG